MRRVATLVGIAAAIASALVAGAFRLEPVPALPTFAAVRAAHRPSDVRLLDRSGAVLDELRTDPRMRRLAWVPLAEISPALRAAIVTAEDRGFANHRGVDWRALAGAAVLRLRGGPARGASTITMQLASILDGTSASRRALLGKWTQIRRALALERSWSKDEILEAYLNRVAFRGELEGIGAAAALLFGKASHGLTDAEALVLASLLRAPNANHAAIVARARALRVALAASAGAIGRAEGTAASASADDAAVDAAVAHASARDLHLPRVALAPHAARRLLGAGGDGDVRSTLDAGLQSFTAASLRRQLLAVREGRVADGAVLAVDNASGDVLAYVASSGALSPAREVDAIVARRQPGSTLKPFLYALAFDDELLTDTSLVDDSPLEISVAGGLYRPGNYDDRFHGLVSARVALASSLNVPAVRTLALVGGEAFSERLRRLGFTGFREAADFYGPALALGSAEVSLWELVNAYRTLANAGTWTPLRLSSDSGGSPATRHGEGDPDASRHVYGASAAFIVADILADREARSLTFGLESPLATPFWTAVKTGTSSDMRDNWAVGFSARYTVGVWVGNASGASMRQVSGVTGAAPVWADVITWLHRDAPSPRTAAAFAVSSASGRRTYAESSAPGDAAAAPRLAAAVGRIVSPVSGTRFALDPDVPTDRQRVPFVADTAGARWRWRLDGADAGSALRTLLWQVRAGAHRLELVDEESQQRDAVDFTVR